jgi:hypothetical protein
MGQGENPGLILITRTWRLNDGCNNNTTAVQHITVIGGNAPPDLVLKDYCVYVNKYGKWTLNSSEIAGIVVGSTAYCGSSTDLTFEISPRAFECKDVFAQVTAVVTARDVMGNTATGTMHVLVLDTISPVAKCHDAVLYLDKFGQALLTPDKINDGNDRESTPDWAKHFNDLEGGSYDNCGISELYLSKQLFGKSNIGKTEIKLTAIDPSGNDGTCSSFVTVYDTITAPVTIPVVTDPSGPPLTTDLSNLKEGLAMKMWPNPTQGKVNIDLTWNSIREINVRVYSVLGVQVLQKQYMAGDLISFDLTGRAPGLYLVEMNVEGVSILHKLILDRK